MSLNKPLFVSCVVSFLSQQFFSTEGSTAVEKSERAPLRAADEKWGDLMEPQSLRATSWRQQKQRK